MKVAIFYSSDTQAGIIEGFQQLGHSVTPFYYGLQNLSLPQKVINKLGKRSWNNLARFFNQRISDLDNEEVELNPDVILFIKGHSLNEQSKSILDKWPGRRLIQWTIDSISRFPGQADLLPYMSRVFFQDGSDVVKHEHGSWLPLGFDSKLFRYRADKTIDLLLTGNLDKGFYKKRRAFIEEASKLGEEGFAVCFAGYNAGSSLLDLFRKNRIKVLGKLSLPNYAEIISASKVCLNVTQDDGGKAINPLFFAIPATGSFEVTDNSPYLSGWLNPGRDYFPADIEILNQTIRQLINSLAKSQDIDISQQICERHSYSARAKNLLE